MYSSSLSTTSFIMCPELIILMSHFQHHCVFCGDPNETNQRIIFHGANHRLPAFSASSIPSRHRATSVIDNLDVGSLVEAQEQDYKHQIFYSLFFSGTSQQTDSMHNSSRGFTHSRLVADGGNAANAQDIYIMQHDPPVKRQLPHVAKSIFRGSPKQRKVAVGSRSVGETVLGA
jgi:hypothetical protein